MNVFGKTVKYKTFSIPIEKEVKNIDINGKESVVTISYKIEFIDSAKLFKQAWWKIKKNDLRRHLFFLIMISINLFCY